MADFGEGFLRRGTVLRRRPEDLPRPLRRGMGQVNREAIREAGREEDIVFFNRSGYIQSPRYSTLFWVGDQLVDWDEHDGIKSAVTGLLTSGLSGYSLEHSDIGGYTAIDNPCSGTIAPESYCCVGSNSAPSRPCSVPTRATYPRSTTSSTRTRRPSSTSSASPESTRLEALQDGAGEGGVGDRTRSSGIPTFIIQTTRGAQPEVPVHGWHRAWWRRCWIPARIP